MGLKKILVCKELLDGNMGKIRIDNSQNKNYNHVHICAISLIIKKVHMKAM